MLTMQGHPVASVTLPAPAGPTRARLCRRRRGRGWHRPPPVLSPAATRGPTRVRCRCLSARRLGQLRRSVPRRDFM